MSPRAPSQKPQRRTLWGALRRVGDALAALLCIWAAWYHTPVGALLRSATAHVLGLRAPSRPLLSYYSGGIYRSAQEGATPLLRPQRWTLPASAIPPGEALGWGAWVALSQAHEADRAQALAVGAGEHASAATLLDARTGPAHLAVLLARLESRWGSEDLAALALFCGEDAARYARGAAGTGADLAALARELPPSLCAHLDLAGEALALGTAAGLGWPLPDSARVTSPFGMREHPLLGGARMHKGVDLSVPEGTSVHAAAAGLVRRASRDSVNGNLVVLDHGHGVTTLYLHNEALLCSADARVVRGAIIARSGSTGRSTGPHLHYQVEIGGQPVDPLRLRAGRPLASTAGATDLQVP